MRLLIAILSSLLATAQLVTSSRHFKRNTTAPYQLQEGPLDTDWTKEVGTDPWPEYPRPQLQRSEWQNLNGVWQYQQASNASDKDHPPFDTDLAKSVLVPFCLESALSGIQGNKTIYNWYRTTFDTPDWTEDNRVLLNFGAVDYEATVFVNGEQVGFHRGGYWTFTIDITDNLSEDDTNELIVFVFDPTDMEPYDIPLGKQVLEPSHIWYTPCSGIWQTVWLESAPKEHITQLDVSADMDGKVNVTVHSSGNSSAPVEITIYEPHSEDVKATAKGKSGAAFQFTVDSPELWSPDSPTLYNITVKMGDDEIESYTGFRTVGRGEINGVQRPLLNGEFIFQFGTLDQGFWPDGIYTAPSKEAMAYDLLALKKIGYNMLRKHIKVEPALFYQACDEIGIMLYQDMPSLRPTVPNPDDKSQCPGNIPAWRNATEEFGRQLDILINQHKSYPSIVTWIIYNEGWGQPRDQPYVEYNFTDRVRSLDPTRLVNAITGWADHGAGDFHDNHHYPYPQCGTPFYSLPSTPYDSKRIGIQGEFGGIGLNTTADHLWKVPKAFNTLNETYEMSDTEDTWNYRAHGFLSELREQIERYACSGAIWTQTTDVEGEVNGMLTYDRRVLRPNLDQWKADIQALHDAAAARGGRNSSMLMMPRAAVENGL